MLLTEDSLQDQLLTDPNIRESYNFEKDNDILISQEAIDLEREALDRLQKVRQRITQESEEMENVPQTIQTLASSNQLIKATNETETEQSQNQYFSKASLSSQSLQRGRGNSQSSKNIGSTTTTSQLQMENNSLNDKYYFKLPPKSSRTHQPNQQTETSQQRAKSKEITKSSVKFEDDNSKQQSNHKEQQSFSKKSSQQDIQNSNKNINSENPQNNNIAGKSNTINKSQPISKSTKPNSIEQSNSKYQQRQDQNKSDNKKQNDKIQIQNEMIKQNYDEEDDEESSIDISQIERIQQKVSERKQSIDMINQKITEKVCSPTSHSNLSRGNAKISNSKDNSCEVIKQSAGLDDYFQNRSPVNPMSQFPVQNNNPCSSFNAQQNNPISPNQFFSSVSSQHRLSSMVTQLTPKDFQQQQQQQQENLIYQQQQQQGQNLIAKQTQQSNQSIGSCTFSHIPNNEKPINFGGKKTNQFQSEHSTIKDETINLQEDTIQDLNTKLFFVSLESKKQQEEIQKLRSQLHTSKKNENDKNTYRTKNKQNHSSSMKNITSNKSLTATEKSTKRFNQDKIIIEDESNSALDSSNFSDEVSLAEEILDLKQQIFNLKEDIKDKNIEISKQSQMLLDQRNQLIKKEKEIDELKTKCKDFELGYNNVQKEVQIIEKQYQIKRLQENQCLEQDLYIQYNEELSKENSEILQKAAKLLEKYKELEYEYKKIISEKEENQHWKTIVQERDQQIYNINRELEYIKQNQLVELSQYKDIIDRLGTHLETHQIKDIMKKFIEVCAENKKHIEFQKQFYDIISSCQDSQNRKSQPLGVRETWELFKKIFSDYLELRKKDRMDITLGNLLQKSLQVKTRDEIMPAFTKKIMENEAYCNIIHQIRYHLKISHNTPLQELSDTMEQLLSKKLYYK